MMKKIDINSIQDIENFSAVDIAKIYDDDRENKSVKDFLQFKSDYKVYLLYGLLIRFTNEALTDKYGKASYEVKKENSVNPYHFIEHEGLIFMASAQSKIIENQYKIEKVISFEKSLAQMTIDYIAQNTKKVSRSATQTLSELKKINLINNENKINWNFGKKHIHDVATQ